MVTDAPAVCPALLLLLLLWYARHTHITDCLCTLHPYDLQAGACNAPLLDSADAAWGFVCWILTTGVD